MSTNSDSALSEDQCSAKVPPSTEKHYQEWKQAFRKSIKNKRRQTLATGEFSGPCQVHGINKALN